MQNQGKIQKRRKASEEAIVREDEETKFMRSIAFNLGIIARVAVDTHILECMARVEKYEDELLEANINNARRSIMTKRLINAQSNLNEARQKYNRS